MPSSPRIVRTVGQLRQAVKSWQRAGERVALTPTMGGLHQGHLSLVKIGRRHADRVVASIFINPTQFGEGEDFSAYPRREAEDAELLASVGCDLIFAPPVEEMYPAGFATEVTVSGLTAPLCGGSRPGHFDGVTTVVAKLLNQAGADVAVFGEKDWQQLVTIRRMVRDLDIPTRIVSAPIVREAGGLAMSSRNRYLTASERDIASKLHKGLIASADLIVQGHPLDHVITACKQALLDSGFDKVDYVEARRAYDLGIIEKYETSKPSRLFAAAFLGKARLIDNVPIKRGTA